MPNIITHPERTDQLYARVPKAPAANIRYRRKLIQQGLDSPEAAHTIWIACKRSILFWINTMIYGFDTRKVEKGEYPVSLFLTYPFQDHDIQKCHDLLGVQDIGVEKSRGVGWTWMGLLVMMHAWLFREFLSFLLLSRNVDAVDFKDDPDCLFWKLDWVLRNLPSFLRPQFVRHNCLLSNIDRDTTFIGTTTTSDSGVGGRKTVVFPDELSAANEGQDIVARTQHTTNCRFVVSTPRGAVGGYYDFMQTVKNKFTTHWSVHPEKNKGLYTVEDGAVKMLDPRFEGMSGEEALAARPDIFFKYDAEFEFRMDAAKVNNWSCRSPWYDNECDRAPNMKWIGQELDCDFHGSDWQYFDQRRLDDLREQFCCDPYVRGELSFDVRDHVVTVNGFAVKDEGRCHLWCVLDALDKPVHSDHLVAGVDVSQGTGASNSCLVIYDNQTCETIFEYANPFISEDEFAYFCVAVCKWFGEPVLVWEGQGPGVTFGEIVTRRCRYRRVFWLDAEARKKDGTGTAGWYRTKKNTNSLIIDFELALKGGTFVPRSHAMMDEARFFVQTILGPIVHRKSIAKPGDDPSGARFNHGDRVTASALCVMVARGDQKIPAQQKRVIEYDSMAGREQRRLEAAGAVTKRDW